MTKVRVPLYGKSQGYALVDSSATKGAVVGKDLLWPDGSPVSPDDLVPGSAVGAIRDSLSDATLRQVAEQRRLDNEVHERLLADIAVAEAAGADATAKANAARDSAIARVDALAAEIGEIVNAPEWSADETYAIGWLVRAGGSLYRAKVENVGIPPASDPETWEYLGQYASVGEVAAAALHLATVNASDLEAEALRIDSLQARMPAAAGELETKARVDQVNQASVDRDGALAESITTVGAQAGNAQSSATSALTAAQNAAIIANSAQTAAGNAQSTATSALSTAEGAALAVTQVQAKQTGGGNLLANAGLNGRPSDPGNIEGITPVAVQWPAAVVQRRLLGDEWNPPHVGTMGITSAGAPATDSLCVFVWADRISCKPGDNIIAAAKLANHRCAQYIRFSVYDAAGTELGSAQSVEVDAFMAPGGNNLSGWFSAVARMVAPANAAQIEMQWWVRGNGVANPYAWIAEPQLEIGRAGQTEPPPWSVGAAGLASATFALQVAQDAQITLTTNVNDHVTGMVSKNDGQRGVISFLADVFEIIASGSVGVNFGRTGRGGYCMRFYASAIQLVLGINFGATNNLCFWYGPNVGEANATKANGTIWFDNSGSAYFRGAIIAGSIRNGGYSTSTAATVTYSTGAFGTIGTPIQVNASYAFNQVQTASAFASTITPGPGSTGATIQLWRKVGSGAQTLVSAQNLTGSLNILNSSDGPSRAIFTISGNIAFMDNEGGTDDRTYEIRMLNRQVQGLSVANGSITDIQTDQATGVTTAEN